MNKSHGCCVLVHPNKWCSFSPELPPHVNWRSATKILFSYGIRRFTAVFTKVDNYTLFWAGSSHLVIKAIRYCLLILVGWPHGCYTNCYRAFLRPWWLILPRSRCSRRRVTRGCPSFFCHCIAATLTTFLPHLFCWTITSDPHLLLLEITSGFQCLGECWLVAAGLRYSVSFHDRNLNLYEVCQF